MHYSLVVPVILKEGFTKMEKRNLRQAIILKNDSLFDVFKKPRNSGTHTDLTSRILFAEICFYFTIPIDI